MTDKPRNPLTGGPSPGWRRMREEWEAQPGVSDEELAAEAAARQPPVGNAVRHGRSTRKGAPTRAQSKGRGGRPPA